MYFRDPKIPLLLPLCTLSNQMKHFLSRAPAGSIIIWSNMGALNGEARGPMCFHFFAFDSLRSEVEGCTYTRVYGYTYTRIRANTYTGIRAYTYIPTCTGKRR